MAVKVNQSKGLVEGHGMPKRLFIGKEFPPAISDFRRMQKSKEWDQINEIHNIPRCSTADFPINAVSKVVRM